MAACTDSVNLTENQVQNHHTICMSRPSPSSSQAVTPSSSGMEDDPLFASTPLSTPIGEMLFYDNSVHELPDLSSQHQNNRQLKRTVTL